MTGGPETGRVNGPPSRRPVVLGLLAVALVAGAGIAGTGAAAGPPTTGHGLDGNLTWVMLTPQPGLEDGDMENFGVPPRGFETVDFVRVTWKDGGFAGCGAGNAEVFGIDRGNDDPGTEVDRSLFSSIKSTKVTEDVFRAEFYDQGDFGGSPPTFSEGDELVGKTTDCIDTPDEPGWYQVQSTIASKDGNFEARSHHFYVCDCANEQAAREQLGPPPSEPTPTPTASPTPPSEPTPTPEPTPTRTPPTEGTPFPSSTPTATPASSPEPIATTSATTSGTAVADDAQGANAGRDGSGSGGGVTTPTDSPTPTQPGNWSAVVEQSPTVAEGPGLGIGAATMGLLLTGLLVRRRR
jgi:hypothetical protein